MWSVYSILHVYIMHVLHYLVAFVFDQFFKSVDDVDEAIFVNTGDVTCRQSRNQTDSYLKVPIYLWPIHADVMHIHVRTCITDCKNIPLESY